MLASSHTAVEWVAASCMVKNTTALAEAILETTCTRILVSGTYRLTMELVIARSVIILGNATFDASGSKSRPRRALRVCEKSARVQLNGITITGGYCSKYCPQGPFGGGIFNRGHLTLVECIIQQNTAWDYGGGLYNIGTLSLIKTLVRDNAARKIGGGVFNDGHIGGQLFMEDSLVLDNTALHAGGGIGSRGGAGNMSGALVLRTSMIKSNTASIGGGMFLYERSDATIITTLVTLNSAIGGYGVETARGGGIYIARAYVLLQNGSQVVLNTGPSRGNGQNVYNVLPGGLVYILPTPHGTFLEPFYRCEEIGCPTAMCDQICDFKRFGNLDLFNFSVSVDDDVPYRCTNGFVCNGISRTPCRGLVSHDHCLPCPAGSWCNDGEAFDCPIGTYTNSSAAFRTTLNDCLPCPGESTTQHVRSKSGISSCICHPGFFQDLDQADTEQPNTTAGQTTARSPGLEQTSMRFGCRLCTNGFECNSTGLNTISVIVAAGYWRPSSNANAAHKCKLPGTCIGGKSPANFSFNDATLCRDGFKGPYCASCVMPWHYVSVGRDSSECRSCQVARRFFEYVVLGCISAVAIIVIGFVLRVHCRRQHGMATTLRLPLQLQQSPRDTTPGSSPASTTHGACVWLGNVWRRFRTAMRDGVSELAAACRQLCTTPLVLRLRAASEATALPSKLKICLATTLIVAQIGDVYQVRYPPSYHSLSNYLFAPFRGQLFGWVPGLRLGCIGIERLVHELMFYTLLPISLIALALGISWCRHHSLLPMLPFVTRFTYVIFPIVSSKGFQAVAECDTFEFIDRSLLRLLPSDLRVSCPIDNGLKAVSWLAILLYGMGVPLAYALLLWRCRNAILNSKPDALSHALAFLHSSLLPSALWWPLIEAMRALLLTGFLALLTPGSITQLLFGLVIAISFLVLQLWCAPYQQQSSNFIAMVASAGLTLQFVASMGVQINSKASGADPVVDEMLLSLGLYVAAFAVFVVTLLNFLASHSLRVDSSSLRMALHDLAGDGQLSVCDIIRALNEPLLSEDEIRVLRSSSLSAAETMPATSDRYTADAADLLLDNPELAARGVTTIVGVDYLELLARMSRGVQAIVEECDAHGTDEDKHWLEYVLHQLAGHHEGLYEEGRAGQPLSYFIHHPNAIAAGLEESHVVALRWYTSPAYESLNKPLRNRTHAGPHPFAATLAFINDGIKRLRALEQPDSSQKRILRLWRGMRNVQAPEYLRHRGGTERAILSTTTDLETAVRFSSSRTGFLFLIVPRSLLQCGAFTAWLSCFPSEQEVLYPPCTYLKPTGRVQTLELTNELSCTVVEVTPHHGS